MPKKHIPKWNKSPIRGMPMVPGPWAQKPALGSLVMVLCLPSALAWLLCVQGGCDRCSPGLVEGCLHLIPYLPPPACTPPGSTRGIKGRTLPSCVFALRTLSKPLPTHLCLSLPAQKLTHAQVPLKSRSFPPPWAWLHSSPAPEGGCSENDPWFG